MSNPARVAVTAAVAVAALAGAPSAHAKFPPLDPCRIAPADISLQLDDNPLASVTLGGLSHKSGALCSRLVVDVKTGMNAKTTLRSRFAGPSSGPSVATPGPALPLDEARCVSYRQQVTIYRSDFGQPFTRIASAILKGGWSVYIDSPGVSHCRLKVLSGDSLTTLESFTSPAGVPARYRVAVAAKIGPVWQPVTVNAAHS